MQMTVPLFLLALCPVWANTIQPPEEYPSEPDEAVALFSYAVDSLGAVETVPASGEIRPSAYAGRTIVVEGTFAGRIAVNGSNGNGRRVLIRIETQEGQSLYAVSPSELRGLRDGERVKAVVTVPTDEAGKLRFELRAIVMEGDLPCEPAAAKAVPHEAAATQPRTNTAVIPGAEQDVTPPQLKGGGSRVPRLAPIPVATGKMPRDGKDGTWDPVGGIGYPILGAETLQVWMDWMRKFNPRLSDRQADWIARWVIYYSALNGVDHRLMFAMIKCESDFNPHCVSRAGAVGLTQLMPCNLKDFKVVNKWNVQEQVRAGVEHFKEMLDMWDGRSNYAQFALAAASYNAGPNAVKRAGGIPNYTETKNYVKKLGNLFAQLCKDGYP